MDAKDRQDCVAVLVTAPAQADNTGFYVLFILYIQVTTSLLSRSCVRQAPDLHILNAAAFQQARQFIGGCATGQDIVHNSDTIITY